MVNLPAPTPAGFLAAAAPGTRVVVRYRIDGGFTDALGHLVMCDAGACTVRTRQADVVIPLERVVAAKEVPPAPEPRGPRRQAAP
ncbi:putative acetyltransferase [Arthrobacter sp. Z1-9]